MCNLRLLPWDTEFFGFAVYQVDGALNRDQIGETLRNAAARDASLVYWSAPRTVLTDAWLPEAIAGRHVVTQVAFIKDLCAPYGATALADTESRVVPYKPRVARADLLSLALQAGHSSRFRLDPEVGMETFERMYHVWINKSCSREIADEVFVIYDSREQLAGMATAAVTGDRSCNIGLISVSSDHQRRGVGKLLMQRIERFAVERGCRSLRVVTQLENLGAVALYQSLGLRATEETAWFHFWMERDGAYRGQRPHD